MKTTKTIFFSNITRTMSYILELFSIGGGNLCEKIRKNGKYSQISTTIPVVPGLLILIEQTKTQHTKVNKQTKTQHTKVNKRFYPPYFYDVNNVNISPDYFQNGLYQPKWRNKLSSEKFTPAIKYIMVLSTLLVSLFIQLSHLYQQTPYGDFGFLRVKWLARVRTITNILQ